MLVRVQPGSGPATEGLSTAEARIVRQVRSWTGKHLPGWWAVNVNAAERGGRLRQLDGVLWTPQALLVVEIKGFTHPQPGTLTIPANGPWTVQGEPAAVHTLAEATPAEQCRGGVFAVKNALTDAGLPTPFISGLIVLVTHDNHLTLGDTRGLPNGVDVVLGTNRHLRRQLHKLGKRRTVWAADDVLAAAAALDLSSLAPQRRELVADGFPDVITDSARRPRHRSHQFPSPQQPHSRGTPPAPRQPARPTPRGARTAAPRGFPPAPTRARGRTPSATPQAARTQPRRRRQNTPVSTAVLLLLVLGLVTAFGALATAL